GRLRGGGLPDHLCRLRVLRADLARRAGELRAGQSAADAQRDRAGMVPAAVLRHPALDSRQAGGVVCMFGSIGLLFVLPWLDTSRVRSCTFRPIYKWFVFALVVDVLVLGYCCAHSPDAVLDVGIKIPLLLVAQLGTAYYFFHFLILLPVLGKIERPLPMPPSIADAVLT